MSRLTLDAGFGSVVEVEYAQWDWTTELFFIVFATAVIMCPIVLCAETIAWVCKKDKKTALLRDPPYKEDNESLYRRIVVPLE